MLKVGCKSPIMDRRILRQKMAYREADGNGKETDR